MAAKSPSAPLPVRTAEQEAGVSSSQAKAAQSEPCVTSTCSSLSRSMSLQHALSTMDDFGHLVAPLAAGPATALEGKAYAAGFSEAVDEVDFSSGFESALAPDPHTLVLRDKASFVAGVALFWVTAHWLGAAPSSFHRLYMVLSVVLFGARFIKYRFANTHYYMFDFCYLANAATVLAHPLLPHPLVHKVLFAFNAGPVAWSILAMRNSLVFHSWEKMITLFMHWYPAAVTWTQRWFPHEDQAAEFMQATFFELCILPVLPYTVWLVAYYLKLFVLSEKKIRERGYGTVYHWMIGQKAHPVPRLVLRYPAHLQPVVYLALHLLCCWACFLLSPLFWHSFVTHTALLMLLSLTAVWNGANFYFEVFAHRYVHGVGLPMKPTRAVAAKKAE